LILEHFRPHHRLGSHARFQRDIDRVELCGIPGGGFVKVLADTHALLAGFLYDCGIIQTVEEGEGKGYGFVAAD
jgi:hypothetical protein